MMGELLDKIQAQLDSPPGRHLTTNDLRDIIIVLTKALEEDRKKAIEAIEKFHPITAQERRSMDETAKENKELKSTLGPETAKNACSGREDARTILRRKIHDIERKVAELKVLDQAIHWDNLPKEQETLLWSYFTSN